MILGVASLLGTHRSSWIRTTDSTGALFLVSGRLHWVLSLVCPASPDESGSLCLTTRDSLTREPVSESWRHLPSPEAPAGPLPSLPASCEDSWMTTWCEAWPSTLGLGLFSWLWSLSLGSLPHSTIIGSAHLLGAPNFDGGFHWIRRAQELGSDDCGRCFLL